MTSPDDTTAGDRDAEIERLRAEVAELRAREGAPGEGGSGSSRRPGRAGRTGRWALSIVLVVLAAVLAITAVASRYVRAELLDTDRYVETVSPLAREPSVQDAVIERVSTEIVTRLDAEQVAEDALSALAERGAPEGVVNLAVPIADQVEGFVTDQVGTYVRSDEFAELWDSANRQAHDGVVAVLTGDDEGRAVTLDDGVIAVDVGVVVERVRSRLVDRGFGLARNIPDVEAQFVLVESQQLESAQTYVRMLDRAATALPFVALFVAAAAILVAPDRRRALVIVALAIALAMVLIALALALVRVWYLDNATGEVLPKDAALDIARHLLAPLRQAMRAVLALGLVVAAAGLLAGPSGAARWVRSLFGRVRAATRGRVEGDREPSAVESWIGGNKGVLRAAIVAAGVLVLAFWTYPSGATVLVIALLVVLGLVVVEMAGWSRAPAP